jgi:hypothetical protein
MKQDRRQELLDGLNEICGELFAEGLSEAADEKTRAVLHGLKEKRVKVSIELMLPPLYLNFGVVDPDGKNRIPLFDIVDPKPKTIAITPLAPGSHAVN